MKDTLAPGLAHTMVLDVTPHMAVPALFPEDPSIAAMPEVLATAWLVAAMELCCIRLLAPHLDDGEGSLGVGIDLRHVAPSPVGSTVTLQARLIAIERRSLRFEISARDATEEVGRAQHERVVVAWQKFLSRLAARSPG